MKNHIYFKYLILILFCTAFAVKAQEKEKNIEGITIEGQIKKYKNKAENPAYAIMQQVWKHKRNNGLSKFDTYRFKEYEKIEFDLVNLDSTFTDKKIFDKVDFVFKYADSTGNCKVDLPIFLTESIYDNFGKNRPDKKNKRLLTAQKTSGFEGNQMIVQAGKNLYKDLNIYDNTLNFFDIGFMSPVSTEGFSTYDYELQGGSTMNGVPVFKIHYQPRRKDVLGFQGFLYISKEKYAVMKASLKSTQKMNVNFVNGIEAEIEYDNPDDETFLPKRMFTRLDISPFSKSKSAKALTGYRTVNYSDYRFNAPIEDRLFETKEEELSSEFTKKDDAFWENHRPEQLSESEKNIYALMAQLEKTPKFNRIVKTYETFASGYYNVGHAIDIGNIYSVYGYNTVEGHRIRLGARTYFSKNDMWRVQGYGAYGFKDEQFKYGVEAKYMFDKVNRFTVGIGTRRDIMQLGVRLTGDDGIMSRSFASSSVFGRGENASLSNVNQTGIFASVEPWKNFQIRLDGVMQSIRSANPEHFNLYYHYKNDELRKTVNDSHVTLSLIARPGAKFSQYGVDRFEQTTLAPTIVLKYTRGIEGLFNADFGYNKLQFMFYKPIIIGSWGKSFFSFEAGKNFNTVPLALQNVIPGNQSYSLAANTFAQMNYYEFVADTYSTLHLEHHFNGKILSYIPLIKKLKLREVAFFRTAYGTLSDKAKAINVDGWRYSAPSKTPYYEYGFGIENIGFGNLRLFRIDFNWRGNYLNNPDVKRFGIKTGLQFFF